VYAVGAAALDEIGPVVEDEQRTVRLTGAAERLCSGDELVVPQILLAQLHEIDAAAQRRFEQIFGDAPRYEVEARPRKARAPGKSIHRSDVSLH
jgi:hypothetical protein